jgi:hypothetical protein
MNVRLLSIAESEYRAAYDYWGLLKFETRAALRANRQPARRGGGGYPRSGYPLPARHRGCRNGPQPVGRPGNTAGPALGTTGHTFQVCHRRTRLGRVAFPGRAASVAKFRCPLL